MRRKPIRTRHVLVSAATLLLGSGVACNWQYEILPPDWEEAPASTGGTSGTGSPPAPSVGGAPTALGGSGGSQGSAGEGGAAGAAALSGGASSLPCGGCPDVQICLDNACLSARRVFVTSTTHGTDFGGLPGADSLCQAAADAQSLGGTWLAWVSSPTADVSARFTPAAVPYVLLDGTQIAADFIDLTDGTLDAPILLDETLNLKPLQEVWTGTNPDGTYSGFTCSDWTDTSAVDGGLASQGLTAASDSTWTDVYNQFCDRTAAFYCFEQ